MGVCERVFSVGFGPGLDSPADHCLITISLSEIKK